MYSWRSLLISSPLGVCGDARGVYGPQVVYVCCRGYIPQRRLGGWEPLEVTQTMQLHLMMYLLMQLMVHHVMHLHLLALPLLPCRKHPAPPCAPLE